MLIFPAKKKFKNVFALKMLTLWLIRFQLIIYTVLQVTPPLKLYRWSAGTDSAKSYIFLLILAGTDYLNCFAADQVVYLF